MNDPHIQQFWLLQGTDHHNQQHVLAVASDHQKLVELSGTVNADYPGLFMFHTITNQGGLLVHLAKKKMEQEAQKTSTHDAPQSRN